MPTNQQIHLVSRPAQQGWPTLENFQRVESAIEQPREGELLVHNHWLSIDPYMRGRMNAARSYAPPQPLHEVMLGETAGFVMASRHPDFQVGEAVVGRLGWQNYALSTGHNLRKVDAQAAPLQAYLGVLGMPGVTAWIGLFDYCQPRAGETVVVTAASGAVGSVVGQLAKLQGCRVVGIAGGPAKCAYVVDELGFDACLDHRIEPLFPALKAATPDRIDGLFENVGGPLFDTLLGRMNAHARIALCGMIAQYNSAPQPIHNFAALLVNRIRLQGFIVTEQLQRWPAALAGLSEHYLAGRVKCRETIVEGLAQAPAALLGQLRGENFGKQLVRLT